MHSKEMRGQQREKNIIFYRIQMELDFGFNIGLRLMTQRLE